MWTDRLTRSDMVLIRKAIANRWNVPAETRARIIDGLMTAMEVGNDRKVVSAARTVVAAEGDNIHHEQAHRDADIAGRRIDADRGLSAATVKSLK